MTNCPRWHRFLAPSHALALALLAAACGSDNPLAPAKPTDPLATTANIEALSMPFSSPVFQSFALVGLSSPAAAAPLATLQTMVSAARSTAAGRLARSSVESQRVAAALRTALVPASGGISAAVLPPETLGKTYEWNASTSQYEATARAGAPTNGVRFILYALDDLGVPIVAQEIGFADLLDESTSSTQRLHLLVLGTTTNPPVTYLDYTVSGTATATSASVVVVGFITDGTRRLDFNATLSGTSSSASIDIRLDVNAENVHVRLRVTETPIGSTGFRDDIDFRLQFGAEVVTLTGNITVTSAGESGSFTVGVNGGIYATITINTDGSVTFAGGGGQELTADDRTALNAIFEAVAVVLGNFIQLLAPAGAAGV